MAPVHSNPWDMVPAWEELLQEHSQCLSLAALGAVGYTGFS